MYSCIYTYVYTYVCLYVCLSIDSYTYTYISPLIQILLYVHLSKYSCINNNIYTIHLYVYLIRTPTCVCVPQRYLSVPVYMVYNSDSVCTFLSTPHCATRRRTAPHRTALHGLPPRYLVQQPLWEESVMRQSRSVVLGCIPPRPDPFHCTPVQYIPVHFFLPFPYPGNSRDISRILPLWVGR
jgi:hypothetical protein